MKDKVIAQDIEELIVDKAMKESIATVGDKDKREYMERIWNMSKEQIFHELMRVHGASAQMIMDAHAEIARLSGLVPDETLQ